MSTLTDQDIERIRKQPEHSKGAWFDALSFARAVIAADRTHAPTRIEDMTNGNSAERESFEKWAITCEGNCSEAYGDLDRGSEDEYVHPIVQRDWEIWQAALSVCSDGGKGEAVYQSEQMPGVWLDISKECFDRTHHARVLYTAPQAECAPLKPEAKLVTFDEFVKYGLEHATSVMNGVPWAFMFNGHAVTHETDDHYLIGTPSISFRRGEVLVATAFGDNRLLQVLVLPQAECAPLDKIPSDRIVVAWKAAGRLETVGDNHEQAVAMVRALQAECAPRADAEKDAALTDAQIIAIESEMFPDGIGFFESDFIKFARAILAANKEK